MRSQTLFGNESTIRESGGSGTSAGSRVYFHLPHAIEDAVMSAFSDAVQDFFAALNGLDGGNFGTRKMKRPPTSERPSDFTASAAP